jgi:hypothetical protein
MRVDTAVVETNIHHPTDSTLPGAGVRVLIRSMKKITKIVGEVGTKLRDRGRGVKLRLLEIAQIARAKGPVNYEKQGYRRLLNSTSDVVGEAKRLSQEDLREDLEEMLPLVRRVMHQTRQRIFHGNTRTEGKIFSVFEPSTEVIRKGKASKLNEFGKALKLQEAENKIVVDYAVYARRPNDCDLLIPAIPLRQACTRPPPARRGCRLLFGEERGEGKSHGRQTCLCPQSLHQERGA